MDPDANLKEQLELARKITDVSLPFWGSVEEMCYDVNRLAELVLALDEWIKKGGFLPQQWQVKK